jgi:hypothetical protein
MLDQAIDLRLPLGIDNRLDRSEARHRLAAPRDHHFLALRHGPQELVSDPDAAAQERPGRITPTEVLHMHCML